MYKFFKNGTVIVDGDEYRVVRVMLDGVLASWERCADHTQVMSSKDIESARMLGVLSVRRGSDHPKGRVDGPDHGSLGMKSALSRKKGAFR